jgi:signal transduction histidine kinase
MAKVQEVEQTKNSFVKNMIQEIKIPMDTVTSYVAQLGDTQPAEGEEAMRQGILENSDYLLHLIDNILYLSRLEAHMVEIHRQPCDFAEVFESLCAKGWARYQNSETHYVVESPYSQLTVDIDPENLGHALEQLTANAAQHTRHGLVRARCEYIGRRLIISVDDTGEGIPPEALAMLQDADERKAHPTKGLGLAICQELVSQMGGTMDITSELGSGTTVYITIPCNATSRKRKAISNKQEQING